VQVVKLDGVVKVAAHARANRTLADGALCGAVMKKFVPLAFALMLNSGCSDILLGPDRVYSLQEQVAFLKSQAPPFVTPRTPYELNEYVTERMFEIDLEYNSYFTRLTRDSQIASVAGDGAILTLTALSTVAPASAVAYKTAYSAAATGVTGFKAAVDKDVLLSHTIQILQTQMETSRAHIRNRINSNLQAAMKTPPIPYTVWQALSDIEDYYRAGTLPGALESLAAAAGNYAQQAKNLNNGTTQGSLPIQTTTSVNAHGATVRTLVPKQ
jgi:hypothetical protein